ncbi:MAG: helix-turn-helix domain-containing protein [Patescibacteria group bacterium]
MLSVGELLSNERIRKNLTLKQVEKEIRIREKMLQAVEDNDWTQFSSKIYITGIIRNYAKYLGLDPNKMLIFFRRDYEKKEEIKFKKSVSQSYLKPETKKLFYGVLTLIVLIFFAYFTFQLKLFLSPPKVTLLSPTTTHFKNETSVKVLGRTEKDATITILGEKVYPSKDGFFEYIFPLSTKKNNLVVEVIGANGKKAVLQKEFIRD